MTTSQNVAATARWLQNVRPIIEDFADRAFQERAWFNRGPEVSSPTELICTLLDTFQFDHASQDSSIELSNEQRSSCLEFARMVDAFVNTHKALHERDVIDDPDWEKIRVAAADLLKVLPS